MTRRIVPFRLIALLLLLGLFDAYDWMPLRVAQRDLIGWSLRVAGYAPEAFVHEGSPAVRVGEYSFFYTAECTYLDLLLIGNGKGVRMIFVPSDGLAQRASSHQGGNRGRKPGKPGTVTYMPCL